MKRMALAFMAVALAGCDRIYERLGMPDPAKVEAEAKATGAGCRHAGRGLEECYRLNPKAPKAGVFAGWKEMNEYMAQRNMAPVPPSAERAEQSAPSTATDSKEAPGKPTSEEGK